MNHEISGGGVGLKVKGEVDRMENEKKIPATLPATLQEKRIVAIRQVGKMPTYNVTMRAPLHNYFVNDVLTANSHSVCYGILAYQTAWLKTHYPSHFWAAVLSSESNDSEKVGYYISCARKQGVVILRPDINLSEAHFVATGESIRFGLRAIRGVGESAVNAILQTRCEKGHFHSIGDIVDWTDTRVINRRVLENLIKAGACDGLPGHRASQMAAVDTLLGQNGKSARKGNTSPGLFDFDTFEADDRLPQVPEWSEKEILAGEKDVLGIYLSRHPVTAFKETIAGMGGQSIQGLGGKTGGDEICVGGYVSRVTMKTTRRGQRFAVFQMEDETGEMEVIMWPDVFRRHENCLGEANIFLVTGRLEVDDKSPVRIIAEQVQVLTMPEKQSLQPSSIVKMTPPARHRQVVLYFTEGTLSGEDMERLRTVIYHHRGPFRLLFSITLQNGWVVRLRAAAGFNVSDSRGFRDEINQKFPAIRLTCEEQP